MKVTKDTTTTITLNREEAQILRIMSGMNITIPDLIAKMGHGHVHANRARDFLSSLNDELQSTD